MRHAAVMKLSDRRCPTTCRNHLPCLLTLMMVLVAVGFGKLTAEEQPPAATNDRADSADSARVVEPTTVWPRRATIDGWIITVYQPQPERLDGNLLTARAAVSVAKDNSEPVFGAEWMSIRLEIDREQRIANASSTAKFGSSDVSDDNPRAR